MQLKQPKLPGPGRTAHPIRVVVDAALRAGKVEPDFPDEMLQFGEDTRIIRGRAFTMAKDEEALDEIQVGKQFVRIDGRPILIESVEYRALQPLFQDLAQAALPQRNARPIAAATLRNLRLRWAKTGVEASGSANVAHTLNDSVIEQSQTGVKNNMTAGSLTLTNSKQCGVDTAKTGTGTITGNLTIDCGVVNASHQTGVGNQLWHQDEPAVAVRVNPNDSTKNQIVIVAIDEGNLPFTPNALLRMKSDDGGISWAKATIGNGGSMLQAHHDADPSLTFDSFGNLFLAYRADFSGVPKSVLYVSTDAGITWTIVSGFNNTGAFGGLPVVVTGPSGIAGKDSIWVCFKKSDNNYYLTGAYISGLGQSQIGTWSQHVVLPGNNAIYFPSLAIGASGELVVVYNDVPNNAPSPPDGCHTGTIRTYADDDGLGSGSTLVARAAFITNFGSGYLPANEEVTAVNTLPGLGWYRSGNRLYVCYIDRSNAVCSNKDTDVYVRYSTNKGISWSSPVKVNATSVQSQFLARLAVDQANGNVGIAWYDCRNDTQNNRTTHLFAAVSRDGFVTAQPRNIQINPASSDATITDLAGGSYKEYIGLGYFRGHLYPAWLDNSNSTGNNSDAPKFDIYVGKVAF